MRLRSGLGVILGPSAALAGSMVATCVALAPWRGTLSVPYSADNDALPTMMAIKNVAETGWYQTGPRLDAPFGQQLYAYPASVGDGLHFAAIRAMTMFTSDPVVMMNVYYLACFLLVGVCAYLGFRMVGLTRAIAAALSTLYAVLPYHVLQGEPHLFLSAYFAVPLASALAIRQAGHRPIATTGGGSGLRRLATRGNLAAVTIVLLSVTTGLYYGLFTIILLAAAGLYSSARDRDVRPLSVSVGLGALGIAALTVAALPTIYYVASHPVPLGGIGRAYGDVERFGARLAAMLLPAPDHRLAALRGPARTVDGPAAGTEGMEPLGIVSATGFLVLLARLLGAPTGRRLTRQGDELALLSRAGLICFLIGTVAGLGAVFAAVTGIAEIRTWARIAVFLAFISLCAVGHLLEAARPRALRSWLGRPGWLMVLTAFVIVGILDQTSPTQLPDYKGTSAVWKADGAFYHGLETALPRGAAVFQMPYVSYPEGGSVGTVQPYDPLRGYLHTRHLRWSYGGVRGQDTVWQAQLSAYSPADELAQVALCGFDAVLVDSRGFEDRGATLNTQLGSLPSSRSLGSDSSAAITAWDISGYASSLRRAAGSGVASVCQQVLHPVVPIVDSTERQLPDNSTGVISYGGQGRVLASNGSRLLVHNLSGQPHRCRIKVTVQLVVNTASAVTLRWPDGEVTGTASGRGTTDLVADLVAPPGVSVVTLYTSAPRSSPAVSMTRASLILGPLQLTNLDLIAALDRLRGH